MYSNSSSILIRIQNQSAPSLEHSFYNSRVSETAYIPINVSDAESDDLSFTVTDDNQRWTSLEAVQCLNGVKGSTTCSSDDEGKYYWKYTAGSSNGEGTFSFYADDCDGESLICRSEEKQFIYTFMMTVKANYKIRLKMVIFLMLESLMI